MNFSNLTRCPVFGEYYIDYLHYLKSPCKTGELITIMTFNGGRDPPSPARLLALAKKIIQEQKITI